MRSRTSRGVPDWSGGDELYIGSAFSAIGNDLGVTGIVPGPPDGSRGSTGWGHPSRRAPWAEVGREPAHSGLVRTPMSLPLRLGLETLGQGAPHLPWGASLPPRPPPPGDGSPGPVPPLGVLYKKGGGRAAAPCSLGASLSPVTPLALSVVAWRSPAGTLLHPPPRRRAA